LRARGEAFREIASPLSRNASDAAIGRVHGARNFSKGEGGNGEKRPNPPRGPRRFIEGPSNANGTDIGRGRKHRRRTVPLLRLDNPSAMFTYLQKQSARKRSVPYFVPWHISAIVSDSEENQPPFSRCLISSKRPQRLLGWRTFRRRAIGVPIGVRTRAGKDHEIIVIG